MSANRTPPCVESPKNIFRLVDRCFPKSRPDKEQRWNENDEGRGKEQNRKKEKYANTDTIFGGCKKHVFARGAAVGPRSDGYRTDLHATFASRCSRIYIRKGGAHRFLPLLDPNFFLFLSSPFLFSRFVSLCTSIFRFHSRILSLVPSTTALFNPRCTHLWVTGSACRVVNSPLNFR